ncbi:MAG: hypothetical protein Q8L47_02550 [bacterium]|nr:hypothetical protein [bacterium]
MVKFKEYLCKKLSDAFARIDKEGKLMRRLQNNKGVYILDSNRNQIIKILADGLLSENVLVNGVNPRDLERVIFESLRMTKNKINDQDRATAIVKLLQEHSERKNTSDP